MQTERVDVDRGIQHLAPPPRDTWDQATAVHPEAAIMLVCIMHQTHITMAASIRASCGVGLKNPTIQPRLVCFFVIAHMSTIGERDEKEAVLKVK